MCLFFFFCYCYYYWLVFSADSFLILLLCLLHTIVCWWCATSTTQFIRQHYYIGNTSRKPNSGTALRFLVISLHTNIYRYYMKQPEHRNLPCIVVYTTCWKSSIERAVVLIYILLKSILYICVYIYINSPHTIRRTYSFCLPFWGKRHVFDMSDIEELEYRLLGSVVMYTKREIGHNE